MLKNKKWLYDRYGKPLAHAEESKPETVTTEPEDPYDRALREYQGALKQKNDLYDALQNREDFAYDVNKDAMYDKLVKEYTETASLAAEDAIGKASALTGGYGNTYAQQVGQQTFQDYMGGLSDEADKLYDRALDRYMLQGDALLDKYALAEDRVNEKYAEYEAQLDALSEQPTVSEEGSTSKDLMEYLEQFDTFEYQEQAEAYLDKLELSGAITSEQADALFEQYVLKLPYAEERAENRVQDYEKEDDGGWNLAGIDRNAKVKYTFKDGHTETLTLGQLFRKLKAEGMDAKQARNEIYKLQHSLGISDRGKEKH